MLDYVEKFMKQTPEVSKLLAQLNTYSPESAEHSIRVAQLMDKYYDLLQLTVDKEEIIKGALLHDIGKLLIPRSVLHKPSALNKEEREIISLHPNLGILYVENFSEIVKNCCKLHHNFAGDAPDYVMALTTMDVFDALCSKRAYKPAFSKEKALNIMYSDFTACVPYLRTLEL